MMNVEKGNITVVHFATWTMVVFQLMVFVWGAAHIDAAVKNIKAGEVSSTVTITAIQQEQADHEARLDVLEDWRKSVDKQLDNSKVTSADSFKVPAVYDSSSLLSFGSRRSP